MSRVSWINGAGLTIAIALTALAARSPGRATNANIAAAGRAGGESRPKRVALPGGGTGLVDATGQIVPVAAYRRIVSTSMITDRLLVELVEPDRILAFSAAGVRGSPWAHQYAGKPAIEGLGNLEVILALAPDLVLMNSFGHYQHVARLRQAGVAVFDLGQLRGLRTLLSTAETLADLIDHPERGVRFAQGFARRMKNVSAALGARTRRRAVYVSVIGTRLYGGTVGTSYHDVIESGGLIDAAAAKFADWPQYAAEQLLELAPEVVVTKAGMGASLCAYPGLDALPACHPPGLIIELPAGLLDEPGPSMLDAAEALFEKAYP